MMITQRWLKLLSLALSLAEIGVEKQAGFQLNGTRSQLIEAAQQVAFIEIKFQNESEQ